MLENASNQELLAAWQEGNQQAAQVLVRRYMVRLTALARSRLSRKLARRIDAEDVVLSAWRSFFVGANIGRWSVSGNDDLWPLLVTITLRKLTRQTARHTAGRRDAGLDLEFDESIDWRMAVSRDPSPEEAAILIDEVESLMDRLDEADREVLSRRLQGEEQATIALAMHCSERTIRRSMQRIRTMIAESSENSPPKASDLGIEQEDPGKVLTNMLPQSKLHPTHRYHDISLQNLIGIGGFGKVYRSVCNTDGSTVAVKFLKKRFWKDRRARDQLLQETRLVSSLSHPSIIRHLGWGETSTGALFVIMDWIDGMSAGEYFERDRSSIREIVHCGIVIADALSTAHTAGLVHGDLTPNNVLRSNDGMFILTDFGFARFVGDRMADVGGGTPGFLAPEQVSDLFGPVGVQTDVYGLGGLIYSLLTGFAPMIGDDVSEIVANVLSSRLPQRASELTKGIPKPLDELLVRCLQKEQSERPESIAKVIFELQKIEKFI